MCPPPPKKYFFTYHLYHSIMRGLTPSHWLRYVIYELSLTSIGLCWLKCADRWKEKGKKTVQHILNLNKKVGTFTFLHRNLSISFCARKLSIRKKIKISFDFCWTFRTVEREHDNWNKKSFSYLEAVSPKCKKCQNVLDQLSVVLILLERLSFALRFSQRLHFHQFLRHDFCDWYLV